MEQEKLRSIESFAEYADSEPAESHPTGGEESESPEPADRLDAAIRILHQKLGEQAADFGARALKILIVHDGKLDEEPFFEEIAEHLGVSEGDENWDLFVKALYELQDQGILKHEPFVGVELTTQGDPCESTEDHAG